MMFVIGDRKTDDMAVVNFLTEHCPNHAYYGIDYQHKLYPKLSALIGENCIQRRSIGFLEALKWGADIVVSIDDDNVPLGDSYFDEMALLLGLRLRLRTTKGPSDSPYPFTEVGLEKQPNAFNGLSASSPSGWFDVGRLLISDDDGWPEHRGFPHTKRAEPVFEAITNARIGVAAGICMGDPDIGAVERIANGPIVHGVSEILRSGVVTDPKKTWAVFNSQNTAVIRELVPAWFMFPHWGRYDDIMASLVVQRIMAERDLHVHFGRPFVWQQRNKHNLMQDLTMEIMGMQNIEKMAAFLESSILTGSVPEMLRTIFTDLTSNNIMPSSGAEAALAYLDECEKVL
jgi:hypothetical protein